MYYFLVFSIFPIQSVPMITSTSIPFVSAPDVSSSAWNCVSGSARKEYFSRSPWATITAYGRGFVVANVVTGGQHPVATWERELSLRSQIAERYVQISTSAGW